MKLTRKALPILLTLNKLNSHFHKLYCYPSQNKLLTLLSKFTSLSLSRRQLNYDLQALESHGILIRIQRHRQTKHRGMEFRSTLYQITLLGYHLLMRAKVISFARFVAISKIIRDKLLAKEHPCATEERKSHLEPLSDILRGFDTASA